MPVKIEPLFDEKLVSTIAKNYNPLDYSIKLIELLNRLFPNSNFQECPKYELHRLISEVLVNNYNGEQILKYYLFQHYFNKSTIVGAFEIKVNNSRADFLAINGHSSSFEIKSSLDNFSKFNKQAADYLLAFEYNYLVVDERYIQKAFDVTPDGFGIWSFINGKHKQIKKACLNTKIDPEIQLKLLSKKELLTIFPETNLNPHDILTSFTADVINDRFKKALKNRYRNRWEFLVANQSNIFPIDLQFFFNTNILPMHVYYH